MAKTAHVFEGSPPSISLNISDPIGGLSETSARNHRSFPRKKASAYTLTTPESDKGGRAVASDAVS